MCKRFDCGRLFDRFVVCQQNFARKLLSFPNSEFFFIKISLYCKLTSRSLFISLSLIYYFIDISRSKGKDLTPNASFKGE